MPGLSVRNVLNVSVGNQTSSSPMTQGRVLLSPKLIHPNTGTEMRRPDFPRLRYSHLDASTEALSWAGRSLEGILLVLQDYDNMKR